MTDKEQEKLEEYQADLDSVEYYPNQMTLHLMHAGSCETTEDYFYNIKETLQECEELAKELKTILKKNKRSKK
jgi:hypothetical protein